MINEIQSVNGFFLQMLMEYREFRELNKSGISGGKSRGCFIYDYMKSSRRIKAESIAENRGSLLEYAANKRKNKYILLEAMDIAKNSGVISAAEFAELFIELTGEKSFSTEDKELVERYKFMFLCGCIDDYFINKGYSVKTGERAEKKDKSGDHINELEMWSEFCKYAQNEGTASDGNRLTEEYEKQCAKLFGTVTDPSNDELEADFVPLYFDSKSGAGIYIVGESILGSAVPPKLMGKEYYVCVTDFSDVDAQSDGGIYLDLSMCGRVFDNVSAAFEYFKENMHSFCQGYSYLNSYSDEEKLDSCFKPFFYFSAKEEPAADVQKPFGRKEELERISGELLENRRREYEKKEAAARKASVLPH